MALISDAGTPILSDPGNNLVKKCIQKKINIIPIPGVSSITSAMSVSGFKDQFLFYGSNAPRSKKIRILINEIKKLNFKYFNIRGMIVKKNDDFLTFSR